MNHTSVPQDSIVLFELGARTFTSFIAATVCACLSTFAIGLRLYVSLSFNRSFGLDDLFIVPGYVSQHIIQREPDCILTLKICAVGLLINTGVGYFCYGFDRHIFHLTLEMATGM
jgi:hypothetical protein